MHVSTTPRVPLCSEFPNTRIKLYESRELALGMESRFLLAISLVARHFLAVIHPCRLFILPLLLLPPSLPGIFPCRALVKLNILDDERDMKRPGRTARSACPRGFADASQLHRRTRIGSDSGCGLVPSTLRWIARHSKVRSGSSHEATDEFGPVPSTQHLTFEGTAKEHTLQAQILHSRCRWAFRTSSMLIGKEWPERSY